MVLLCYFGSTSREFEEYTLPQSSEVAVADFCTWISAAELEGVEREGK